MLHTVNLQKKTFIIIWKTTWNTHLEPSKPKFENHWSIHCTEEDCEEHYIGETDTPEEAKPTTEIHKATNYSLEDGELKV